MTNTFTDPPPPALGSPQSSSQAGLLERPLFVGAHLDDIEIAAGGVAARSAKNGGDPYFLVLSDSSYTRWDGRDGRQPETARREGEAASCLLGVRNLDIRGFAAKDIENHSSVVEVIESVITSYRPSVIITHWPFDTHKAHMNVALTTIAAARREPSILFFEPFFPSGRSYQPFRPQMYFSVTDEIDAKLNALRAHTSEYEKFGDEWVEAIRARAFVRGYESGGRYAESFEVLRVGV